MVSVLRTAQSQVLRCPCFFKCYVPVIIIDLQRLSASEQIPGLFSQVLSWGTALRYSDGTNKGSEWDLEPRRVSRVKTMERLQCQGKGFGFDYPVQGSIRHFRPGLWLEQNWASGISPFGCCISSWQGRRTLRGGKARRTGLALSQRADLGNLLSSSHSLW